MIRQFVPRAIRRLGSVASFWISRRRNVCNPNVGTRYMSAPRIGEVETLNFQCLCWEFTRWKSSKYSVSNSPITAVVYHLTSSGKYLFQLEISLQNLLSIRSTRVARVLRKWLFMDPRSQARNLSQSMMAVSHFKRDSIKVRDRRRNYEAVAREGEFE